MQFQLYFPIQEYANKIKYPDKITLIGSCFTEHIGKRFANVKMGMLQNPHGILFNPISVCASLRDVMRKQVYTQDHLFELHEMWHSWAFHSRFSGITPQDALQKMNASIAEAHTFLQQSQWLIITLGSAFAYRHNDLDMHVSNNHRAPANWFTKELLDIDFIKSNLQQSITDLQQFNPGLKIIFTISPVRHVRDGVVENNKSKARLLEAVHDIVANNTACYYFPSYEIVIDELRDYRFYDADLVHPNYAATEFVWQRFKNVAIDKNNFALMDTLNELQISLHHKSQNPTSNAHQLFLKNNLAKCHVLVKEFPFLNLEEEIKYFGGEKL